MGTYHSLSNIKEESINNLTEENMETHNETLINQNQDTYHSLSNIKEDSINNLIEKNMESYNESLLNKNSFYSFDNEKENIQNNIGHNTSYNKTSQNIYLIMIHYM